MSDKEKKNTLKVILVIGLLILIGLSITSLTLLITDFNPKDLIDWILSNFGITGLSIGLKFMLNKKHEKNIKELVGGKEMKKIEETLFNGFSFTIGKDNQLIIKDTLRRQGIDYLNAIPNAMLDYTEHIKKSLL